MVGAVVRRRGQRRLGASVVGRLTRAGGVLFDGVTAPSAHATGGVAVDERSSAVVGWALLCPSTQRMSLMRAQPSSPCITSHPPRHPGPSSPLPVTPRPVPDVTTVGEGVGRGGGGDDDGIGAGGRDAVAPPVAEQRAAVAGVLVWWEGVNSCDGRCWPAGRE